MIDPDTPYPPEPESLPGPSRDRQPLPSPMLLLAVVLGGALGTLARYGVANLFAGVGGAWSVGTFTVNLVGAFALGLLLHTLTTLSSTTLSSTTPSSTTLPSSGRGSDQGRLHWFRLVLGTGFLGAFTTYSALAMDVVGGFLAPHQLVPTWLPIAYGVSSVLLGLACCGLGVLCAERIRQRRTAEPIAKDARAER